MYIPSINISCRLADTYSGEDAFFSILLLFYNGVRGKLNGNGHGDADKGQKTGEATDSTGRNGTCGGRPL